MSKISEVISNPYKIMSGMLSRLPALGRLIPDDVYLKIKYKAVFNKRLDLNNPVTFNEKLQWLKLYDRNPRYIPMVDKYEAKKYVANIIGEEYIIPTLGVWDCFEEIDFDELPEQFVLKCTHDSGGIVICKNKACFDKEEARKKLSKSLKHNYYWSGREWPYKNVKPRIIAEKYMEEASSNELKDYKFFCFNGIARCFKVDYDRFVNHFANYFDTDGNMLPFGELTYPPNYSVKTALPDELGFMKKMSEVLAKDTNFLRVDFYDVNGKVYFGELTFYPMSGFGPFTDIEWDRILGSWIQLPGKDDDRIGFSKDMVVHYKQKKGSLTDYKVHCFNGEPKLILVCKDRFSKEGVSEDFYDCNWNHLSVKRPKHRNSLNRIERPLMLEKMLELSTKLSQNVPFLRCDYYLQDNNIYFGELTFYPASGLEAFEPSTFDTEFGKLLQFPDIL